MAMTFSFSSDDVHMGNTVTGVIVQRRSNSAEALTMIALSILHQIINSGLEYVHRWKVQVTSHTTVMQQERLQFTNRPTQVNHDRNTVEQSELNYVPQKTNFRHPHLHLSSTLTRQPSISPSSLCKPCPPTLIKVKEAFQIKLMRADVGPLPWLSADVSTQSRLRLNGPGDSRFGVSVYPPPGQSVHTLTPACQRREQQDITREREQQERESRRRQGADGESFHISK